MSDIEFEIVKRPTPGKPGIMRRKEPKSLEQQLVDLGHRVIKQSNKTGDKEWQVLAEEIVSGKTKWRESDTELCRLLLAIEERDNKPKPEKDPTKVYRSDIHSVSKGNKQGWKEGQHSGKKYYQYTDELDGTTLCIFHSLNAGFKCCAHEVIEDM